MKKKFVSFLLASIMLFSCTVPAFATAVEPRDNKYKTVVVTDPTWTLKGKFEIKNKDATSRDTVRNAFMAGLTAITAPCPEAAVLAGIANIGIIVGHAADPYGTYGKYTVEFKNRITYEENRITGERHVRTRQQLYRITILANDNETYVKEYTVTLK